METAQVINLLKDKSTALRKVGMDDSFIDTTIAHLRELEPQNKKIQRRAAAVEYILSLFGPETQKQVESMIKSLMLTGSIYSKYDLFLSIGSDLLKCHEMNKFLVWCKQRGEIEESGKEGLIKVASTEKAAEEQKKYIENKVE